MEDLGYIASTAGRFHLDATKISDRRTLTSSGRRLSFKPPCFTAIQLIASAKLCRTTIYEKRMFGT